MDLSDLSNVELRNERVHTLDTNRDGTNRKRISSAQTTARVVHTRHGSESRTKEVFQMEENGKSTLVTGFTRETPSTPRPTERQSTLQRGILQFQDMSQQEKETGQEARLFHFLRSRITKEVHKKWCQLIRTTRKVALFELHR